MKVPSDFAQPYIKKIKNHHALRLKAKTSLESYIPIIRLFLNKCKKKPNDIN